MSRHPLHLTVRFGAAVAVAAAVARGQGFDDADEPPPPVQPVQNTFLLNEGNLAQWGFGATSLAIARTRLESALALTIDGVDRSCGLSADQRRTLLLAGRGDLKRVWDRIEEKKRKYLNVPLDQNQFNAIVEDLQSVRAVAADTFGDTALFRKALRSVLTPEQRARYEQAERERQAFRVRAKVDLLVTVLDQSVGFGAAQRQALLDVLLREVHVPRLRGAYDYQLVMYEVSRVPQDRLRPIVDDRQWRVLQRRLEQGRALEPFLVRQGLLPPSAAAARPAPARSEGARATQ